MVNKGEDTGVWAKNGGVWAKIEKVGKECIFVVKGVISLGKEKFVIQRNLGAAFLLSSVMVTSTSLGA